MRIVLDTNVLVRANIRASGPARELLLRIILSPAHVLVLSPFLLRETQQALSYPRLKALWRLTLQEIQEHIELLERGCVLVHPVIEEPVVRKDPNDDPVIFTAVTGKAEMLCTRDQDFFDPAVLAYCRRRGIRVLGDVALLAVLEEEARH